MISPRAIRRRAQRVVGSWASSVCQHLRRVQPAQLRVLGADVDGIGIVQRAQEDHADQLILGDGGAAVEVGGAEQRHHLNLHAQLFHHFAVQGLFEAFTLVDAPGDALPGAGAVILGGGAAQQQVALDLRRPDQGANATVEFANAHVSPLAALMKSASSP